MARPKTKSALVEGMSELVESLRSIESKLSLLFKSQRNLNVTLRKPGHPGRPPGSVRKRKPGRPVAAGKKGPGRPAGTKRKGKPGRPPGSKNVVKRGRPAAKRRGRPAGSKNKK